MTYFAKDYGIQPIRSTPFYAQANGQAEASNKVLINIMENVAPHSQPNPIGGSKSSPSF